MSRSQKAGFLLLAMIALLIITLAVRNRPAPQMPRDREHTLDNDADRCLTCHMSGSILPQSKNHPVRRDCMSCHSIVR
jgi:hypothetical protein